MPDPARSTHAGEVVSSAQGEYIDAPHADQVLVGTIVERNYKGKTLDSIIRLPSGVELITSEFFDEHTRAASLRGGSRYQPQTSHWYFPQAYQLDQHGKYLLMAPCKDRSAGIGFRCVVDAA